MEKLIDTLSTFDCIDKKGFLSSEVIRALNNLPISEIESFKCRSEHLAFSFQENAGKEYWDTYFGPMIVCQREDNGELIFTPCLGDITPEDIAYWEHRVEESVNPLMRIRYAGLVYDFKRKITSQRADYKRIILPYFNALVEAVEGGYYANRHDGYMLASRALDIAARLNSNDLFCRAQEVLWEFEKKGNGYTNHQLKLMIKYLDRYSNYEKQIIDYYETRFNEIENKSLTEGENSSSLAFHLENLTDPLCEYYVKRGFPEMARSHIDRLVFIERLSFPLKGGLYAQSMLQKMQSMYRKYHFYEDAENLYHAIQEHGKTVLKSLKPFNIEIQVDNKKIEKYYRCLMQGDAFVNYLNRNVIAFKECSQKEEETPYSSIEDIIQLVCFDELGIPISNIDSGKNSKHNRAMFDMRRRVRLSSPFLHYDITKLVEEKIMSPESVMKLFENSPLILEESREIVSKGFEAYFNGDYIVACHLLVPQFESAIRYLVALKGGSILRAKSNPSDGNEHLSLEGLLDSCQAQDVLGEEINTYFKNVFTEKDGCNLRNLISHGLIKASGFNYEIADRIVHAFLILSQIKFQDSFDDSDTVNGKEGATAQS